MTDLDRFLELSYDYAHGDGLTEEEEKEYQSLKSQLESKLAESEALKPIYSEDVCIWRNAIHESKELNDITKQEAIKKLNALYEVVAHK